uniref:Retrotransposon Copia-like N-terminal domain-containing protein n=1 Tax=Salix viminalis TaxID=40686 RepID=A0A6N2L4C5_SALVM
MFIGHLTSAAVSAIALYSDSTEDRDPVECFLEVHDMKLSPIQSALEDAEIDILVDILLHVFFRCYLYSSNNLLQFVSVKLEGPSSYLNWSSQVKDALSIHDLLCFIDGTESCQMSSYLSLKVEVEKQLDFTLWNRKNWFVLVWMKSIISDKVLSMVYGLKTARQAWQGGLRCSDFIEHAKALADQLAAVGKPMDEADLISLVLGGLNTTYNPFVSNSYFSQRENPCPCLIFNFDYLLLKHSLKATTKLQAEHNNFAMMAQNLGDVWQKKIIWHLIVSQLAAMAAQLNSIQDKNTCIADSGASTHYC